MNIPIAYFPKEIWIILLLSETFSRQFCKPFNHLRRYTALKLSAQWSVKQLCYNIDSEWTFYIQHSCYFNYEILTLSWPDWVGSTYSGPVWQLLLGIPSLKLHKTRFIMLKDIPPLCAVFNEYHLNYELARFLLCFSDGLSSRLLVLLFIFLLITFYFLISNF